MISDHELVAACRQGSQDAFRRLVDRHWAGVVRAVTPLLDDPDDVEDAAQEAFIRACRRLDELKDPDRLPAWLHAIARNAARKMLRQRRLEQQRLPDHDLSRGLADPELGSLLGYRDLKALVNTLAPPDRAVVTLFYLAGMELKRIAERLDIPVGTAKSRLHRSRRLMRERIRDMSRESPERTDSPDSSPRDVIGGMRASSTGRWFRPTRSSPPGVRPPGRTGRPCRRPGGWRATPSSAAESPARTRPR